MPPATRRQFLGAASALTLSAASYTRAANGPNETVRVAVLGVRSRGKQLLPAFTAAPNVEVTHLVDPDSNQFAGALAALKKQSTPPKTEADLRRVLDDKSVTAVVVAAPDHWHALATVWACQAGKHVYCEKPASHNLREGRRMVDAARKHNRVVQVGTQRRSANHVVSAREYVQAGKLGKVAFARAWIAGSRKPIGNTAPSPVPAGVDYNLWLGPADGAFTANRFHYNWHWFWDLGTGELGNNGIHGLDLARNVLGVDAPTRVTSTGGKYVFAGDDGQTPDTQTVTFEFPGGPGGAAGCTLVWEHRVWEKGGPEGEAFGIAVHGDKGTLLFGKKGWSVRNGEGASDDATGDVVVAHVQNFVSCVRDGKRPAADIEIGHASTRLCHLGNIAHRVGRVVRFDAATEAIVGDPEANAYLGREYRKGFELPA